MDRNVQHVTFINKSDIPYILDCAIKSNLVVHESKRLSIPITHIKPFMTTNNIKIAIGHDELKALAGLWESFQTDHFFDQYTWHMKAIEATNSNNPILICFLENQRITAILPLHQYQQKIAGMTYNIIGRYKPDRLNFHNIITYQKNGTAYPLKNIHDALKSAGVKYDYLFIDRIFDTERFNLTINDKSSHLKHKHQTSASVIECRDGIDGFLSTLSRNRRQKIRQKTRKLSKLGSIRYEISTDASKQTMFNSLVDMENSGWKGTRGTSLKKDNKQRLFFQQALAHEEVSVHALKIDDTLIASHLSVVSAGIMYIYKIAFDESYKQYSPGELLLIETIRHLDSSKIKNINLVTNLSWHQHLSNASLPLLQCKYYRHNPKGVFLFFITSAYRFYKNIRSSSLNHKKQSI
ncbi:MAG: GNAT family N-acetyltransferase [Candidatus Thiodiazotropha sp. (ex Monitilora ramsayi)]|nr:GNAT family N-acetyltransferase [Candidatus Thiodiazotropha sp. (ex Monitilora ramsayi)]